MGHYRLALHPTSLTCCSQRSCRYPLVVKLGTITPSGADVYSYAGDEDDMVTDPHLAQHLAHWGINMMQVGLGMGAASLSLMPCM